MFTPSFVRRQKAYSSSFLEQTGFEKVTQLEAGDKIILSSSLLHHLTDALEERMEHGQPLIFSVKNLTIPNTHITHVGCLEFSGEQHGVAYFPSWIMSNLLLEDGSDVEIRLVDIPTGVYLKLKPADVGLLHQVHEPKLWLEDALRSFTAATEGDSLIIHHGLIPHQFKVVEVKPSTESKAISLVGADIELDFDISDDDMSGFSNRSSRTTEPFVNGSERRVLSSRLNENTHQKVETGDEAVVIDLEMGESAYFTLFVREKGSGIKIIVEKLADTISAPTVRGFRLGESAMFPEDDSEEPSSSSPIPAEVSNAELFVSESESKPSAKLFTWAEISSGQAIRELIITPNDLSYPAVSSSDSYVFYASLSCIGMGGKYSLRTETVEMPASGFEKWPISSSEKLDEILSYDYSNLSVNDLQSTQKISSDSRSTQRYKYPQNVSSSNIGTQNRLQRVLHYLSIFPQETKEEDPSGSPVLIEPESNAVRKAEEDVLISNSPMRTCSFCGSSVPEASFVMHEAYCSRNSGVCRDCGAIRRKKEMNLKETHIHCEICGVVSGSLRCSARHQSVAHSHFPCELCGEPCTTSSYAKHRKSECSQRLERCDHCGLPLQVALLPSHSDACGARTEACRLCGMTIIRKNRRLHEESHCLEYVILPSPSPFRRGATGNVAAVPAVSLDFTDFMEAAGPSAGLEQGPARAAIEHLSSELNRFHLHAAALGSMESFDDDDCDDDTIEHSDESGSSDSRPLPSTASLSRQRERRRQRQRSRLQRGLQTGADSNAPFPSVYSSINAAFGRPFDADSGEQGTPSDSLSESHMNGSSAVPSRRSSRVFDEEVSAALEGSTRLRFRSGFLLGPGARGSAGNPQPVVDARIAASTFPLFPVLPTVPLSANQRTGRSSRQDTVSVSADTEDTVARTDTVSSGVPERPYGGTDDLDGLAVSEPGTFSDVTGHTDDATNPSGSDTESLPEPPYHSVRPETSSQTVTTCAACLHPFDSLDDLQIHLLTEDCPQRGTPAFVFAVSSVLGDEYANSIALTSQGSEEGAHEHRDLHREDDWLIEGVVPDGPPEGSMDVDVPVQEVTRATAVSPQPPSPPPPIPSVTSPLPSRFANMDIREATKCGACHMILPPGAPEEDIQMHFLTDCPIALSQPERFLEFYNQKEVVRVYQGEDNNWVEVTESGD